MPAGKDDEAGGSCGGPGRGLTFSRRDDKGGRRPEQGSSRRRKRRGVGAQATAETVGAEGEGVQRRLAKDAGCGARERLVGGHGHGRLRGGGRQRGRCGRAIQGGEASEGGLEGLRLEVQQQRRPGVLALRVHQAGLKVETLNVGERCRVQAGCAE